MSTWLESAGSGSGIEFCVGQIVPDLISDIVPATQKMLLQASSGGGKRNKKKKGGGSNGRAVTHAPEVSKDTSDSDLGQAAVRAVQCIVTAVGPWLDTDTHTKLSQCVMSQLVTLDDDSDMLPPLLSCVTCLVTCSAPHHVSPLSISIPVVTRLMNNPKLSQEARNILQTIQSAAHPARYTYDIKDSKTANQNGFDLPQLDSNEEDAELETSDTSTQTDKIVSSSNTSDSNSKDLTDEITKLKADLNKFKKLESEARVELMRKDVELSRLKISGEKRSIKEPTEPTQNGVSSTKKPKLKESTENLVDDSGSGSNLKEGQLSVEEMMKDFSDKLNKNIIPKFTQDSDSD